MDPRAHGYWFLHTRACFNGSVNSSGAHHALSPPLPRECRLTIAAGVATESPAKSASSHAQPWPAGRQGPGQFAHARSINCRRFFHNNCDEFRSPIRGRYLIITHFSTRARIRSECSLLAHAHFTSSKYVRTRSFSLGPSQFFRRLLKLQRLRFAGRHSLPEPGHVCQALQAVGVAFESSSAVPCVCPSKKWVVRQFKLNNAWRASATHIE